MIDLDELIAPARPERIAFAVPGMARPTVLEFTPISANNPHFLDATLRAELDGSDAPKGLAAMHLEADRIMLWCAPTLTIDGEDRTADVAAFLHRLVDLAPRAFSAIDTAIGAASTARSKAVDTQALEGNSSPA